jgi:hypothetical protein
MADGYEQAAHLKLQFYVDNLFAGDAILLREYHNLWRRFDGKKEEVVYGKLMPLFG